MLGVLTGEELNLLPLRFGFSEGVKALEIEDVPTYETPEVEV